MAGGRMPARVRTKDINYDVILVVIHIVDDIVLVAKEQEMAFVSELVRFLNRRRRQLGVTYAALAERSGVSLPTVRRILADGQQSASLSTVLALAGALGVRLNFDAESDVDVLLERQARQKAEHLVGMVQGSSALEGQGLDEATRERMVRQTIHELLAGSKRKLWAAW